MKISNATFFSHFFLLKLKKMRIFSKRRTSKNRMRILINSFVVAIFTIFAAYFIFFNIILEDSKNSYYFDINCDLSKFIKKMSLEAKIGQLFVFDINGAELTNVVEKKLKEYHIGNFILMGRNLLSPGQTKQLSSQLTEYSKEQFHGVPPFISIDQECGSFIRMFKGCTIFPGFMTIAATGSLENCERISELTAEELSYVGINLNYSPVADVNSDPLNPIIGDRSFGDDPETVSKYVEAFIRGHHKKGVLTCAKHFPGHGSTRKDSHLELPQALHSLDQMKQIDLPPFQKAIESNVDLVMVGHLLTPFDSDNPSSISPKVISYLKNELGFKGLVITDSMVMRALDQSKFSEMCMNAILAGCDLVCACEGMQAVEDKYEAIKYIAEKAKVDKQLMNRIDESVMRILEVKRKILENGSQRRVQIIPAFDKIKQESQKVYDQSITLYRNDLNILPLSSETKDKYKKIYVLDCDVSEVKYTKDYIFDSIYDNIKGFDDAISIEQIKFHPEVLDSEKDRIQQLLNENDLNTTIFMINPFTSKMFPSQKELINMISSKTENVVLVSLSNPYEYLDFKDIKTIIIGYEFSPMSIQTISNAITGKIDCKGKMPFKV